MGRTVTPLSYDFAGSNPALPTKILKNKIAGVAQLVERQPSKLNVAGSNPVSRSKFVADIAQLVERILGRDEVTGSNPVVGSILEFI